jgi:hypothetical protein
MNYKNRNNMALCDIIYSARVAFPCLLENSQILVQFEQKITYCEITNRYYPARQIP